MFGKRQNRSGVTLVELIMVVVIIAILASILVSKYSSHIGSSKISATKANLQELRTAIELYYATNDSYPGSTLSQMTSDANGKVFVRKIPDEKVTPSSTVVNTNNNVGGWHYNTSTHEVLPNKTGNDADGNAYSGY
jgi:general secretion pathway protein G